MLSEETASGNHPVEAVRIMDRIIRKAESIYPFMNDFPPENITQSIAGSSARMSAELNADAIITFTRTGTSAIQISRYRPPVPIIAVTHSDAILRRLSLVWGCVPLMNLQSDRTSDELISTAINKCVNRGYLNPDSIAVITSGIPFGKPGTTNSIRIVKVRDVLQS